MPISIEYLVVAGGGGGGSDSGGGGGAGGLLTGTASKNYGTTFTITVGAGGTGGNYPTNGTNGGNSVFDNITATGGGKGATETFGNGSTGGSGGGGSAGPGLILGGSGTTGEGNAGGNGSGTNPSSYGDAGGGGGAGGAGSAPNGGNGGAGGAGVASSITGTSITYAGGGGGGTLNNGNGGAGGSGGGGAGGGTSNVSGTAGTANTGGGGGGGSNDTGGARETGGNGGSGVVILKVLTSDVSSGVTTTGSPTVTTSGSYNIYKYTASGTINFTDPAVNITVNAGTISNIAIAGQPATISAGTDAIVSTTVSNTAITGINATVTAAINVQVENSPNTISITSFAPDIAVQGSIIITINASSNIAVNGKDATVTLSSIVDASKASITIVTGQVNPLYPSFVLQKNPIHYYRFNEEVDNTQILDYGTSPVNASAGTHNHVVGIPGDPESESIEFVGTTSGTSNIVTFPSRIFDPNTDNATYEFWIRTTDWYVPVLVTDEKNFTLRGIIWGGQTNQAYMVIGVYAGYLGLWSERSATDSRTYPLVLTDSYIADGNWHHIVLTKSKSGSITTYASYVDRGTTNNVISLGDFLPYSDGISVNDGSSTPVRNSFMAINDDAGILNKFDYVAELDEVAIYDSVLSTQEINDHYFSGLSETETNISVTVSNIGLDAKDALLGSQVGVIAANIGVTSRDVSLKIGGNVAIGANRENITVTGHTIIVSDSGSIIIEQQVSNTNIKSGKNRLGNKRDEFKFIASSDTSPSARDASTLTGLDYGGLLYNQIKKLIFRIGNTSTTPSDFIITSYANETQVTSAVQFSYDNITYTDSLTIEGILPNDITEVIYVKFDVNNLDVLGIGTFLVSVEQQ